MIMNVLVIDGQGGGVGRQLISAIKEQIPGTAVNAVGTNSAATGAMLKAGADNAATGENAVLVGCRRADVIIGPIGIALADSMGGEITAGMAAAVGQSEARKILIPVNHCSITVAGVSDFSIPKLIQQTIAILREMI